MTVIAVRLDMVNMLMLPDIGRLQMVRIDASSLTATMVQVFRQSFEPQPPDQPMSCHVAWESFGY
jgi:hypothetical protein